MCCVFPVKNKEVLAWVISPPCSGVSESTRMVRNRSGELGWFLQTTRFDREHMMAFQGGAVQRNKETIQSDTELMMFSYMDEEWIADPVATKSIAGRPVAGCWEAGLIKDTSPHRWEDMGQQAS
eukprot:5239395-Prorocentrum_lima.AAC.1